MKDVLKSTTFANVATPNNGSWGQHVGGSDPILDGLRPPKIPFRSLLSLGVAPAHVVRKLPGSTPGSKEN